MKLEDGWELLFCGVYFELVRLVVSFVSSEDMFIDCKLYFTVPKSTDEHFRYNDILLGAAEPKDFQFPS